MGRFRQETTIEAFKNVYKQGGGMGAFWRGTSAKMVESASKGSILLFSKEAIANSLLGAGVSQTTTGFLAGAGGGVCQVVVMGPCTFLITAAVTATDGKHVSVTDKAAEVWKAKGIKGFYPGGTAIAFRQATNWACRQGFTDGIREQFRRINHGGDQKAKLSVGEEVASGIIGGALVGLCWCFCVETTLPILHAHPVLTLLSFHIHSPTPFISCTYTNTVVHQPPVRSGADRNAGGGQRGRGLPLHDHRHVHHRQDGGDGWVV